VGLLAEINQQSKSKTIDTKQNKKSPSIFIQACKEGKQTHTGRINWRPENIKHMPRHQAIQSINLDKPDLRELINSHSHFKHFLEIIEVFIGELDLHQGVLCTGYGTELNLHIDDTWKQDATARSLANVKIRERGKEHLIHENEHCVKIGWQVNFISKVPII